MRTSAAIHGLHDLAKPRLAEPINGIGNEMTLRTTRHEFKIGTRATRVHILGKNVAPHSMDGADLGLRLLTGEKVVDDGLRPAREAGPAHEHRDLRIEAMRVTAVIRRTCPIWTTSCWASIAQRRSKRVPRRIECQSSAVLLSLMMLSGMCSCSPHDDGINLLTCHRRRW